jgi:hypothetical protein
MPSFGETYGFHVILICQTSRCHLNAVWTFTAVQASQVAVRFTHFLSSNENQSHIVVISWQLSWVCYTSTKIKVFKKVGHKWRILSRSRKCRVINCDTVLRKLIAFTWVARPDWDLAGPLRYDWAPTLGRNWLLNNKGLYINNYLTEWEWDIYSCNTHASKRRLLLGNDASGLKWRTDASRILQCPDILPSFQSDVMQSSVSYKRILSLSRGLVSPALQGLILHVNPALRDRIRRRMERLNAFVGADILYCLVATWFSFVTSGATR